MAIRPWERRRLATAVGHEAGVGAGAGAGAVAAVDAGAARARAGETGDKGVLGALALARESRATTKKWATLGLRRRSTGRLGRRVEKQPVSSSSPSCVRACVGRPSSRMSRGVASRPTSLPRSPLRSWSAFSTTSGTAQRGSSQQDLLASCHEKQHGWWRRAVGAPTGTGASEWSHRSSPDGWWKSWSCTCRTVAFPSEGIGRTAAT
mmetsp:Transcript_6500/g.14134  ORF Transcript_6500/g.14134 Transcript_6500/m.14134 type:complete len:207 (+) Transcript_6500:173-793(+)